jgi:hypothetical protein
MEPGLVGQSNSANFGGSSVNLGPYYMGGYGTYTGTAPTSIVSATWSAGCGGGSATITSGSFHTNVYQSNDYIVTVSDPGVAGTCTLTVTDNRGEIATSPVTTVVTNSTATTTYQVHNAPGWKSSNSYTYVAQPPVRVNNGAGWTPGSPGSYTPGAALKNYQLIAPTSGSCTSAGSGGPSGTGSSITDGGCTWKYTSGVDYVTLTGALKDGPPWVSGTTYTYGQYVTTNVGGNFRSYSLDGTGGNPINAWCTSTDAPTGAPTGGGSNTAGFGRVATSDGCFWDYMGDVVYSSQVEYIPVQTTANGPFGGGNPHIDGHMPHNYEIDMWNDAEYVAASGGESNPIYTMDHYSGRNGGEANPEIYCPQGCRITIKAADGESFGDTLTASSALTGYDATKGVAIRNPNSSGWTGFGGGQYPVALATNDWNVYVDGIQFKATNGAGVLMINQSTLSNAIVDGGSVNDPSGNYGAGAAVGFDLTNALVNSLIISRGTTGVWMKYGDSFILFDTIVNVGSQSNTVAISHFWAWVFQNVVVADTAIYGFSHDGAWKDEGEGTQVFDASSKNNVTDIATPDSGTTWYANQANASTVIPTIPGTTYGQTGANMFVSPGTDWRPGSSLVGAGASYGSFSHGCIGVGQPTCTFNYDTPDFLNLTRPQAGSWTVGPEQHP